DGRLSGICAPVVFGVQARVAIVLAEEAGEPVLCLISLDQDSVQRRACESIDPTLPLAQITFRGALAERMAPAGSAADAVEKIRQRAAVLYSFEQVGGTDRVLEMARDYAVQRRAFGRPIGSYQAIKHKLADIYIKTEIARAHAYYGAWALSTNASDL